MAIFVILPRNEDSRAAVQAAVEQTFSRDHLALDSGEYLISTNGTPIEVARRLGITPEGGPSAIVFSIAGYWGRAPSTVWDWLKAKLESVSDG
jgi:hypothetical protein